MYKRTVKTAKPTYFDKKIQEIALLKNNSKRCAGMSSDAEKEVGLKANRMTGF